MARNNSRNNSAAAAAAAAIPAPTEPTAAPTAPTAPTAAPTMRKGSVLTIIVEGDILTMRWADGTTEFLDISKLSDEVRREALVNGLDGAALSRDPETGASATIRDKRARVSAIAQNLREGNWNAPSRATGNNGASARAILVEALIRMKTQSPPEVIRNFVAERSAAEVATMSAVPRVAAIISAIRAERIGTAVDAAESALNALFG